jgi:MEDS: MEthanogen/methylotroph, DcmR Sensory domain
MACSAGFGIDGVTLQPGDHVCGLFFGWLDRDKLLVPFFRTGLRAGDRCVIVTDRTDPTPILRQLGPDADTDQWRATGQLQLRTANDQPAHTSSGLGHDDMLTIWRQAAAGDDATPSRFLRIGGEVSWWAPVASPAELARYEAELNRHIGDDMAVLCLYDLSRFSPEAVIEAVMTHPVVHVGDVDDSSRAALRAQPRPRALRSRLNSHHGRAGPPSA